MQRVPPAKSDKNLVLTLRGPAAIAFRREMMRGAREPAAWHGAGSSYRWVAPARLCKIENGVQSLILGTGGDIAAAGQVPEEHFRC
jgi:hypothetical protein